MHDRISTDPAPAAVGAYSQETATGDLMFTAGQVPLPPEDDLLDGTDIDSFGPIAGVAAAVFCVTAVAAHVLCPYVAQLNERT